MNVIKTYHHLWNTSYRFDFTSASWSCSYHWFEVHLGGSVGNRVKSVVHFIVEDSSFLSQKDILLIKTITRASQYKLYRSRDYILSRKFVHFQFCQQCKQQITFPDLVKQFMEHKATLSSGTTYLTETLQNQEELSLVRKVKSSTVLLTGI